MAANLISQLSTANTFQHWLGATQSLIGTANLLTDGNGQTFFANTRILVGGTSANVSLNVETGATINVITANTTNTVNLQSKEVVVTGNITSLTTITMNTGTGTYQTGELVFQGPNNNVTYANSTAIVQSWNTTSNVLSLIQLSGTFNANTNTYAQLSNATQLKKMGVMTEGFNEETLSDWLENWKPIEYDWIDPINEILIEISKWKI